MKRKKTPAGGPSTESGDDLRALYEQARERAERAEAELRVLRAGPSSDMLRVAAEEVQRSERLMHAVFSRSADGILLLDEQGNFVDANAAAAELFGQKKHVLLRRAVASFAADPNRARALFEEIRTAGALRGQVEIVRGTEKRTIDFRATANIVPGLHLAVLRDVTEDQRAEAERERLIEVLRFERGRLGSLLESAPSFFLVLRGEALVVEMANEAYLAMVGRRDIVGRKFAEAFPEFVDQGFVRVGEQVLSTGVPFHARRLGFFMEGRPDARFVSVVVQALSEPDGRRTGVFVHGVDVTEEVLSEDRIRAQFNAVPVPIYAWHRVAAEGTDEYRLADYNDAANALTSGLMPELVGRSAQELFPDDGDMVDGLARCLRDRETFQREADFDVPHLGGKKRLALTFAPAPGDVVLVHAEDLTERRRLESQLRQAQKMDAVGRLAGGIAHDFNNLLTVILSYTQLALADLDPDAPLAADLQEVRMAADRAVELTKQLLAFSRQQVLQPRILSVDDTLRGVDKMLRRILGEAVDLRLELGDVAQIEADPGQIEQVILNLAINARDAMPGGGTLTLSTSEVELETPLEPDGMHVPIGSYVVLSVKDTGIGMDAATRARIFEPFFTTKGPSKGTGLGLATVFGIVQQSRGAIRVDSEPGAGATFHVYLPRATSARAKPGAPAPVSSREGQPGGTETVLVVEDDASVRGIITSVLRRAGYKVLEAPDGEAALELAKTFEGRAPALLLTDVVMPKMNGRVLVERLTKTFPKLRTVFMSGYTNDDAVLRSVFEARSEFLQKPFTPGTLLQKVQHVLRKPTP